MAVAFRASLIDPATGKPALGVTTDCLGITIVDESNYTTATEPGHNGTAKFADFRKVIITHQDGGVWKMSSLAGGDQLITTPAVGVTLPNYTIGFGDGVYAFNLITVPTWNIGAAYVASANVYVYYNGFLYHSILDGVGHQPDISPTFWTAVPESSLPIKYSVTEKISVFCALNVCWEKKLVAANCTIKDNVCNDDLICKNKAFLDSLKTRSLLDGIIWTSEKGNFDLASVFFTTAKKICSC